MGTLEKIIIYGAGGHGKVLADALQVIEKAGGGFRHIGYCDDNAALLKVSNDNILVYCLMADLSTVEHDSVVIAIGDNQVRKRKFIELSVLGERISAIMHPGAIIAADVRMGEGVQIIAGAVINTGATIGDNSIINTGCTIDHDTEIGDHVHIAPGSNIGGCVSVGEGTLIGIGATVLQGCSVGAWSIVGAGAVVTRNVAAGKTVVGVPAKELTPER